MIAFPNAKINIGLQVTGKRPDGYHDIDTLFYPVAIKDALEIITHDSLQFRCTGNSSGDILNENICIKAYQLLKNDFPLLPPVSIHLHKAIPVGAGLGGGSADAVACLQLLNNIAKLGLNDAQLKGYALQLGSDCPFFLINKTCYATGRGEELEEIALDLSAYRILIVNPGIHVNTAWAFSQLKKISAPANIKQVISEPIEKWKDLLINDFEMPVFAAHPPISSLKDSMYNAGAIYASMSGSGSSVFGIFEKTASPVLNFPGNYFSKWA